MKPLHTALDLEISKLKEKIDFKDLDTEGLVSVMNESKYMLKINGFARKDFRLILNNKTRDFYGYKENDISHMNMNFYFQVFHPSTMVGLIKNWQFFSRNDLGYLEVVYTLKNYKGNYVKVSGISKTVAWNVKGEVLYALSLMCLQDEYLLSSVREHFKFDELSPREHQVLEKLILGQTNGQIASDLSISDKTVEKSVSSLYKKGNVKSRAEFFKILNQIM